MFAGSVGRVGFPPEPGSRPVSVSNPPLSPDERADTGTPAPGDLAEAITPRDKASRPPWTTISIVIVGEAENPKKGPTNLPVINTHTLTGYEYKYDPLESWVP